MVPVLKPDLVLIGVLELDDLAQLYENNYGIADHRYLGNDHISVSEKIRYVLSVYINVSFHNILSVFSKKGQTEEIQPEWKEQRITCLKNSAIWKRFVSMRWMIQCRYYLRREASTPGW